jgi:ParB-like nuclease domain
MNIPLPLGTGIFKFPDECWRVCAMDNFVPSTMAYATIEHPPYPFDANLPTNAGRPLYIQLAEIEPLHRELKDGIPEAPLFRSMEDLSRVVRAMRSGDRLPPIWITEADLGLYRYRLVDGLHRFYSAIALGFTHIPAIVQQPLFSW